MQEKRLGDGCADECPEEVPEGEMYCFFKEPKGATTCGCRGLPCSPR